MPRAEVLRLIEKREWSTLIRHDQLRLEREAGNAFAGFREGTLAFRPTYKYLRGELTAEGHREYTDEKMRIPSWCDRVLWKNLPGWHSLALAARCLLSLHSLAIIAPESTVK